MTGEINTSDGVILDSAKLVTYAERPEFENLALAAISDTFPEYNNHGNVLDYYWSRLDADRPEFQFYLVDRHDGILARAKSLPIRWDGTVDDLPAGLDDAFMRSFEEPGVNALCAVVIAVPRELHGRGISSAALAAMRKLAHRHGIADLIAPVRPNWKDRYPLIPIEQYANWRRSDGLPFDPWMRTHERVGGAFSVASRSRSGSQAPSPSGKSGRRWLSHRAACTGSPVGSPKCRLTEARTWVATGIRTSGCTIGRDVALAWARLVTRGRRNPS